MKANSEWASRVLVVLAFSLGCAQAAPSPPGQGTTESSRSALSVIPACPAAPKLDLKIRQTRKSPNEFQYRFQVFNRDTAPVRLSDLSLRLWLSNGPAPLAGNVFYGGEVRNASGRWQYAGIAEQAGAKRVASCSVSFPDARVANWQIEIKSSDTRSIPANGGVWDDSQFGIHRADWANFDNPNDDYSQIPAYQKGTASDLIWPNIYGDDAYFVLYYRGAPVAEWTSASAQDVRSGHEAGCLQTCALAPNTLPLGSASKLSPLLQLMKVNPALAESFRPSELLTVSGATGNDARVFVVVDTTGGLGGVDAILAETRGFIGPAVGGLVRLGDLAALDALPSVVRVRESIRMLPTVDDNGRADMRADLVASDPKMLRQTEGAPDEQIQGQGIQLAVIDTGIDWCHQDFTNANGTTRIKYLWDQTLTRQGSEHGVMVDLAGGGTSEVGVLYDAAAINAALPTCNTALVRSTDTKGHGTHVAGIAAGRGRATGNFKGVAPEADLVIIKTTLNSTDITSAVRFTSKLVNQNLATNPAAVGVINMSFGGHVGAHDGSDAESQDIEHATLTVPGFFVNLPVISAGNDGISNNHAQASTSSGTVDLPFSTTALGVGQFVYLDAWLDQGASYTSVMLQDPAGTWWGPYPSNSTATISYAGGAFTVAIKAMTAQPQNGEERIQLQLINHSTSTSPVSMVPGNWTLRIQGLSPGGLLLDAWLYPTMSGSSFYGKFTGPLVSQNRTMAIPGTTNGAFTVASYVTHGSVPGNPFPLSFSTNPSFSPFPPFTPVAVGDLSVFSSRGPIRPGNIPVPGPPGDQKPDIAAPGEVIASVLSRFAPQTNLADPTDPGVGKRHTYMQGTSQAAPAVAGAIALVLSGWDRAGGPQFGFVPYRERVQSVLFRTARRDSHTGGPADTPSHDDGYGWGKLDVLHAVLAASVPKWTQVSFPGGNPTPPIAQVLVSPSFGVGDQTVFVLSSGTGAGVYKTTDGSMASPGTYSQLTLPSGVVPTALALHPGYTEGSATTAVVYLGATDAALGGRLWKSSDGGSTWTELVGLPSPASPRPPIGLISLSPGFATDNTVFLTLNGSGGGLYRSTNGGAAWSAQLLASVQTFFVSPLFAGDQRLLAWTGSGPLQLSTDAGSTWAAAPGLPSDTNPSGIVTAIAASKPVGGSFTIFAVGGDLLGTTLPGPSNFMAQSQDGGQTWTSAAVSAGACSGGCPSLSSVLTAIAISPDYAKDAKVFTGQNPNVGVSIGDGPPAAGVFKSFLDLTYTPAPGTLAWVGGGFGLLGARTLIRDLLPITCLAISPNWRNDTVLVAGTSQGLYWDPLGRSCGRCRD